MEKAKKNNDPALQEQYYKEHEELLKTLRDAFTPKGTLRLLDRSMKRVRDRVTRNIKHAYCTIERHDRELVAHFQKYISLKHPVTYLGNLHWGT